MRTPEERYLTDAYFKILVDVLTRQLIEANYTRLDILEAGPLACKKFEYQITQGQKIFEEAVEKASQGE